MTNLSTGSKGLVGALHCQTSRVDVCGITFPQSASVLDRGSAGRPWSLSGVGQREKRESAQPTVTVGVSKHSVPRGDERLNRAIAG